MLAYICTQITTTKKLNKMKTSAKLNKIIEQAQNYIYGGNGYNSNKFKATHFILKLFIFRF